MQELGIFPALGLTGSFQVLLYVLVKNSTGSPPPHLQILYLWFQLSVDLGADSVPHLHPLMRFKGSLSFSISLFTYTDPVKQEHFHKAFGGFRDGGSLYQHFYIHGGGGPSEPVC